MSGILGSSVNFPRPGVSILTLKPGTPVPSGSDITDEGTNAIVAGDMTIRDTNAHYFIIPMAAAGWRSCTIFMQNGTVTWDQTLAVHLFNAFQDTTYLHFGRLLSFTLSVNSNTRFSIGTNAVSAIGGTAGADPSGASGYAHYSVPALSDGWPYLALRFQATVAPTAGEIQRLVICRMRF